MSRFRGVAVGGGGSRLSFIHSHHPIINYRAYVILYVCKLRSKECSAQG